MVLSAPVVLFMDLLFLSSQKSLHTIFKLFFLERCCFGQLEKVPLRCAGAVKSCLRFLNSGSGQGEASG
ncbi:MAG: hypothetical protein D3923_00515 [Candidatus Electrothrix sp. AR3]|nr:hypothetical protein [Candidatus Electrothrix sp. AR3]